MREEGRPFEQLRDTADGNTPHDVDNERTERKGTIRGTLCETGDEIARDRAHEAPCADEQYLGHGVCGTGVRNRDGTTPRWASGWRGLKTVHRIGYAWSLFSAVAARPKPESLTRRGDVRWRGAASAVGENGGHDRPRKVPGTGTRCKSDEENRTSTVVHRVRVVCAECWD